MINYQANRKFTIGKFFIEDDPDFNTIADGEVIGVFEDSDIVLIKGRQVNKTMDASAYQYLDQITTVADPEVIAGGGSKQSKFQPLSILYSETKNLKTVQNFTLLTVPTGYRFMPYSLMVVIDTCTGFGDMPVINFGTGSNAALFVSAYTLDASLTTLNVTEIIDITGDFQAAGTNIKISISTASTFTTHTASFAVNGFLIPEV